MIEDGTLRIEDLEWRIEQSSFLLIILSQSSQKYIYVMLALVFIGPSNIQFDLDYQNN